MNSVKYWIYSMELNEEYRELGQEREIRNYISTYKFINFGSSNF